MKKRILFLLLLILFIILITCSYIFTGNDYNINFYKSKINTYIEEYKLPSDDIDIIRIVDSVIYGVHIDTNENGDLYLTKGVFTYNIETDDFNYFENPHNNRIVDFYSNNEDFYVVFIEKYDDKYKWSLTVNFDEKILDGIILSFFSYPSLLISTDNILLAYIDNVIEDENTIQNFNISKLDGNNLVNLLSLNGNINTNEGFFVKDISRVLLNKDDLIYVYENSNKQFLSKFNLINHQEVILYENKDENINLYSYLLNDDILYYQLIYNSTNVFSKLYLINSSVEQSITQNKIFTFENFINNNILMHNSDSSWTLYNINENKLYSVDVNKNDFFPKYHVLFGKYVVAIDYNNEIYIGDFVK